MSVFLICLTLSPIVNQLSAFPLCLKGAIHVHSFRSHDSEGSFEEIARAARKARLDFVVLTDHFPFKLDNPEVVPADSQSLVWIDGLEVSLKGNKYLVVGLKNLLKSAGTLEAISQAKAEGALAFASHLRRHKKSQTFSVDGAEIYSLHEDFLHPFWRLPEILYESLTLREDRDSLHLALLDEPKEEIDVFYRIFKKGKALTWIAGNDAHQNLRFFARQIDPYEDSFGFVSTYVWASAKTESAILKALSQSQSYIGFPWIAPADGFIFRENGRKLEIRLPADTIARIRLYRGEKLVLEREASGLSYEARDPGIYRAAVLKKLRERELPWIYSSPIYKEGD